MDLSVDTNHQALGQPRMFMAHLNVSEKYVIYVLLSS